MTFDFARVETVEVEYQIIAVDEPKMTKFQNIKRNARAGPQSSLFIEIKPIDNPGIDDNDPNFRIVKPMIEKTGKIPYAFDFAGTVEVCILLKGGPLATVPAAMVSLKIIEQIDEEKFEEMEGHLNQELKQAEEQKERELEHHHESASRHMSHMEHSLHRLLQETNRFVTSADYMKDQEAIFYQKSVDMNQISKYWPILHLIVLIVTGFTQANHIIKFFKSRHII